MKNVKAGDILCVKPGHGFVSKGIGWWMKLYKKKNFIKISEVYSHNARIVDIWGELYVCEANAKGIQTQPLSVAYTEKEWENRINVLVPEIPYNEEELRLINKLSVNYSLVVTRYDYFNFIFHLIQIITGWWIGPTGAKAEKKLYCSEFVAHVENLVRPDTFRNDSSVNPIDVAINSNFFLNK
jgi:hypothetical protein